MMILCVFRFTLLFFVGTTLGSIYLGNVNKAAEHQFALEHPAPYRTKVKTKTVKVPYPVAGETKTTVLPGGTRIVYVDRPGTPTTQPPRTPPTTQPPKPPSTTIPKPPKPPAPPPVTVPKVPSTPTTTICVDGACISTKDV